MKEIDKKIKEVFNKILKLELESVKNGNKIDDSFQQVPKMVYNRDYNGLKDFYGKKVKEYR